MTARATPGTGDSFDCGCPECPDFDKTTIGTSRTMAALAAHDKKFHPLTYEPARHPRSVRDLPAMIDPAPADGVTSEMQTTARRSREIDGDGRVALPSIRQTINEMSRN
ncbi:hypothetical protein E3T43_07435 [Cryobacterium sp. Hh7]|uniref:hypothetical protein n=1 Tax=Cryobacterium sp. Hh7 TaxID=1259159 RepID=UPI00106D4494|nr:hypothetical protein [Cryobacterium sp. Hh7]TFD58070.1 hypothetical protein E3T43_07435 [Cryobacterium sp. Hh7]